MTARLTMQAWGKWSWQRLVRLGKIAGALRLDLVEVYFSDIR